jgi:glycosyltransferase involved in cell wall biosynthesis
MKVLLVHNDYGKYSGEEAVVDKMAVMLSGLGYDVAQLRMSTANARENISGKIRGFISGLYCPSGVKAMRKAIEREHPDVINVHNLYPFISPAALRECKKAGIPVVMTIHNFRLMCPTGLFMRDGKPCELCLQKGNEWGCVRYNCEKSMLKSIGYAARNAIARIKRHYIDCVDIFACITDFQRQKLIEAGFPKEKLIVIPNSIDVIQYSDTQIGGYVGYCGRISYEKGGDIFVELARRNPQIHFKIAGTIRDKSLIGEIPNNLEILGYVSGEALSNFYSGSRFIVMPSRCYEGFPMTILEAANYNKPVITPDHGGFTEIIGHDDNAIGQLFTPGDIASIESAIIELWNDTDEVTRLGNAAHCKLTKEYSIEVISQKWNQLIKELASRTIRRYR